MRAGWLALLAVAACATRVAGPGPTRFADQPIVWAVNDRMDIPLPEKRRYPVATHFYDRAVLDPVTRPLSLPLPTRAANTNALDEVPGSTWFTNRIGRFPLSPAELVRGPESGDDPMALRPWTVISSKVGGTAPGYVIEDRAGNRYLLKLDPPGFPENETGAHVIVQRILWAAGYHVPDDRVVFFSPADLRIAPDAVFTDARGDERPLTRQELQKRLGTRDRVRALASRFVDGKTVGGFADEGTRPDDPNDRVPHQLRRELRGLQPIVAWLGHTDVKEANTVVAWAPDPADPTVHYLVHYLIDFGKALGNAALMDPDPSSGFAHIFDWSWLVTDLFSLGLRPRPWDGLRAPRLRGVGLFESERYDPAGFRTNMPFRPFVLMDRSDGFWGAKLMMRFTPAHIRAAVETARFSDSSATEYLVRTLRARQLETARYWFGRLTPADRFEVVSTAAGLRLCSTDLMAHYELEDAAGAWYGVRAYDFEGRPLAIDPAARIGDRGRVCTGAVRSPGKGGYVIVELAKQTRQGRLPATFVHVAGQPPRVIGVERR